MVLSLSAKELTHDEISAHLAEVYGAEISKSQIPTITDSVMAGMTEWQNRPLDSVYPVVFIDCVNVTVGIGQVANRPVAWRWRSLPRGTGTSWSCGSAI
jgi:transposase-like protein